MLKNFFKKILPNSFIKNLNSYCNFFFQKSYSQNGEDILINSLLNYKKTGYYVDVGAFHPYRFSNTYLFYKKGWRGVNIDAMPGSMKLFNKKRPRDINIEQSISDINQTLTYYMFNEPALNGFSNEISKLNSDKYGYEIILRKKLKTKSLTSVLKGVIKKDQEIDFISIDTEGYDFNVLKSLDLQVYKPKIILIEDLNSSCEKLHKNKIVRFLKKHNYILVSKVLHTLVFLKKQEKHD